MPIDLANNGYNPSIELTQVKASPSLQDVTVRSDSKTKSQQLMEQFGNLKPEIEVSRKLLSDSEKQKAENLVNSMTTEELSRKINSGELSSANSPVFNATVNNMHYNNISQRMQRDTLTKLANGTFNDEFSNDPDANKYNQDGTSNKQYRTGGEKLENYLIQQRNETLAGADKFGIAGFDKVWQPFVQKALTTNAEAMSARAMTHGHNVAVESYMGAIAGVGTPADKMARFVEVDDKTEWLFKGDKTKRLNARLIPLEAIADAGDPDSLDAILNHKDKNGISIGSTLGSAVNSLRSKARSAYEANQRKAQVDGLRVQSESSIETVKAFITDKIAKNRAWDVDEKYPIVKPDGTLGTMPSEPIILAGLKAQAEQLQVPPEKMDVERMNIFNRAGQVDPDMKIRVQAGIHNLNSVQYDAKGKPLGELNDSLKISLDLMAKAKSVDPTGTYARKLAGSEESYKALDNIALLKQYTGRTTEEAAQIVAIAKGSRIYGANNSFITKNISEVTDTLNSNWFMRLIGNPDNATMNIDNIQKGAIDSANLLVQGGMSAKDAVEIVKDSFTNNVANINGNLMFIRGIPSIPEAKDNIVGGSVTLFQRFVEEIGGQAAYQTGFKPDEVTVVADPDGNSFRLMAKGQPLNGNGHQFIYTKEEIQKWMKTDLEVAKTDAQYEKRNGLFSEIGYYRKQMNSPATAGMNWKQNAPAVEYLTSRTGYRKLKQAGLENKPKDVQIKWAQEMMQQGFSSSDPATPMNRTSNVETPAQKAQIRGKQ